MSETKRRLSNNNGFLGPSAEDNDDDDDDINTTQSITSGGRGGISSRRSLGGRRRSSFGSHSSRSPGSSLEQSRIAEMYKNVIKMSSENVRPLSDIDVPHHLTLHIIILTISDLIGLD